MITMEELLKKAVDLPSEDYIQGWYPTNLLDLFVGDLGYRVDCDKLKGRMTFKILYKKVDWSQKYGNVTVLLLWDGEPMTFFTQGCKWLDTFVEYRISDEKTNRLRSILMSLIELDEHEKPSYMQHCLADGWFEGDHFESPDFPYISISDDY